jgi:hypothetical protein
MRREWRMSLSNEWRAILLDRVKTANRAVVAPDEDFLSFEFPLEDWKGRSVDFVK